MMTDAERDSLLQRLDERTEKMDKQLDNDFRVLYGNGHPGLVARVGALEVRQEARGQNYGVWQWVITTLIAAAAVAVALLKH